jgi:hypothetical protein
MRVRWPFNPRAFPRKGKVFSFSLYLLIIKDLFKTIGCNYRASIRRELIELGIKFPVAIYKWKYLSTKWINLTLRVEDWLAHRRNSFWTGSSCNVHFANHLTHH